MTDEMADNPVLLVPGISNFRDFGSHATVDGRALPRGLFFRSAHLGGIGAPGLARLSALGISKVVDLRGRQERLKALPAKGLLNICSAPVEPGSFTSMELSDGRRVTPDLMRERIHFIYRRFATEATRDFGAALAVILQADGPLLIHCTAGKDRTGFMAALVLSLLGVGRAEIVADYLLTNDLWDHAYEGALRLSPEVMAPALAADAAYLETAFEAIERNWGSVEDYAAAATGNADYAARLRKKVWDAP
ncbi:MAG: tyrosine-protein phosphatase [Rhizobiaceae bacterium]|nr:tyrosine-protein phosphatase [Rhizobiaceae bacterium]MCV0404888.1 tyrosine-protein phosphatase [Rhizobiaceae bacterium]